jgi:Leucine-rich repeat (LRR) protein
LAELSIGGDQINDSGLQFLKLLPGLRRLDLHGVQRTDSGLWSVSLTDAGLEAVTALSHVQELNLAGSRITDLGMAKLSSLQDLRMLDLSATQITAKGLESLAGLKNLRKLVLWKCARVDDAALPVLRRLTLDYLDTQETKISATAISELRR